MIQCVNGSPCQPARALINEQMYTLIDIKKLLQGGHERDA